MERTPEHEIMDGKDQTLAYAQADFTEPNSLFVRLFKETFSTDFTGVMLDLGCGPADIPILFVEEFPACQVHGVDGAANMLRLGRKNIAGKGLQNRVVLLSGTLPGINLPRALYDAVVSNSLLHHLQDPMILWEAVHTCANKGAPILIMDLMRPEKEEDAFAIVEKYSGDEPEILRKDFYNSLLAAYEVEEVRVQLDKAGLSHLTVEAVSGRHLAVKGRR